MYVFYISLATCPWENHNFHKTGEKCWILHIAGHSVGLNRKYLTEIVIDLPVINPAKFPRFVSATNFIMEYKIVVKRCSYVFTTALQLSCGAS